MTLGLSGKVLPVHPQPKPGEIFSSWYCRIAQSNCLKLHTLEVQLWGRDKQIWTRDIDRSIDDATLRTVADISGTPIEIAQETCLRSYEGNLFQTLNEKGNSSWILPSGIFHRKRKLRGMQFCPMCLIEDETPYFRKSWRLALVTFCEQHDVMLHDCCPKCDLPVVFHRQELGQRWHWEVSSLSLCTSCGFDLKRAAVRHVQAFEIHTLIALKAQLFFLGNGWTFAGDQTFHYSYQYFDVLRNLVQKLPSHRTTRRMLQYVQEKFSLEIMSTFTSRTPFEFYSVKERHYLIQIATWLLMDWPNRFLDAGKETRTRFSELMQEFEAGPFWFNDGSKCLEFKPVGPSEGERAAMRGLLVNAEHDEIRLDRLKKNVRARIANHSVRELWAIDSLRMPSTIDTTPTEHRIIVTAWRSKKVGGVYGIRLFGVSKKERPKYFPMTWTQVEIEIDGVLHAFPLRKTFWGKCPEFRGNVLEEWLRNRNALKWEDQFPPKFELHFIDEKQFHLVG